MSQPPGEEWLDIKMFESQSEMSFQAFLEGRKSSSIGETLVVGSIPRGSNTECKRVHDSDASWLNQNTNTKIADCLEGCKKKDNSG